MGADNVTWDRCRLCCRLCMGMGYKGRDVRGKWRIGTCRRCGGTGRDPRPETLPENKPEKKEVRR